MSTGYVAPRGLIDSPRPKPRWRRWGPAELRRRRALATAREWIAIGRDADDECIEAAFTLVLEALEPPEEDPLPGAGSLGRDPDGAPNKPRAVIHTYNGAEESR